MVSGYRTPRKTTVHLGGIQYLATVSLMPDGQPYTSEVYGSCSWGSFRTRLSQSYRNPLSYSTPGVVMRVIVVWLALLVCCGAFDVDWELCANSHQVAENTLSLEEVHFRCAFSRRSAPLAEAKN